MLGRPAAKVRSQTGGRSVRSAAEPLMRAVDELRTGAEICGGHSRFGREARRNFVKKCEKDAGDAATRACDAQAAEKKLSGAAKTGFTKKCVSDAMAAAPAK